VTTSLSVHIDAPVEQVFDYYQDPDHQWAMMPEQSRRFIELTDVKRTEGGVGTYSSWVYKVGPLRREAFDVVTEFVPNDHITDRASQPIMGTMTTSFRAEGSGTRVTIERRPGSFWRFPPLDWLVVRLMTPVWAQSLGRLKAAVEQPTAGAPRARAAG
jgi:uncharacterized protein YndB with AHSA1/START domain